VCMYWKESVNFGVRVGTMWVCILYIHIYIYIVRILEDPSSHTCEINKWATVWGKLSVSYR
jgi:hypothetical protein